MEQPSSPLNEVEALLNRFYHRETSNEEKQHIERRLHQLQHTTFNWRFCLAHLIEFNNPYVWFFAVSTVERTLSTAWNGLSAVDRDQLYRGLLQLYHGYPADVPALHRDKIAQIVAQVGRRACADRPESYGPFVDGMLQLFRTKFLPGLALCGAIGDSVTQTKEDGPGAGFGQVVQRYVPAILQELNRHCALFALMAGGMASGTELDGVPADRKNQYCSQLMGVLQQYFSWMRLDQLDALQIGNIAAVATSGETLRDGAIGGVIAFTELLYRNECLLPDAGRQLAASVFGILAHATQRQSDELYTEKVCELVRQYIKRGWPHCEPMLAHSEGLFQQLYQFTVGARSPAALAERINVWAYVVGGSRYLDDGETVQQQQQQGTPSRPQLSGTMAFQLVQFLNSVLFVRSYADLQTLDSAELDDNSETELQRFINQNIDIQVQLVKLLERPQVEVLLYGVFFETVTGGSYIDGHRVFVAMVDAIRGHEAALNRYSEEQLQDVLSDYVTACRYAIELCDALYGEHPEVDNIVHQATCAHAKLLMDMNRVLEPMIHLSVRMAGVTRHLFTALAQHIRTTKHLCQFGPRTLVQVPGQGTVVRRITPFMDTSVSQQQLIDALPAFLCDVQIGVHKDEWIAVVRAVIELLSLYAPSATHGALSGKMLVDQLCHYGVLHASKAHLDRGTRSQLHQLVCRCLLQFDQEANGATVNNNAATNGGPAAATQSVFLDQYLDSIGTGLLAFRADQWKVAAVGLQLQIVYQLVDELRELTDILLYFRSESNSRLRARLAHSVARLVERAVNIFRDTVNLSSLSANNEYACELVDVLLDFFCQSVGALQSRMDMGLLRQVLELLHGLFVTEVKANVYRLGTALKMVRTFRSLVPDPRNKPLVPVILRVALDELLPVVASDARYTEPNESLRYEDVLGELYELLHDLVHHRWQHFVQTNPMLTSEPDLRAIVEPEPFLAIMNAYGFALTSNTGYTQVVRTVLTSLITLDERRYLYRLPLFIDRLMDNFIQSLLKLALSDTGPMHFDQIVKALYGMSRVDPIRLRVHLCDMNLARDAETFRMLQIADDPSTFQAVIGQMIKLAKTASSESEV